ncbi:MGT family glycosyltransferase [Clostridium acetobutylicum]|uniref:Predicted glycosyltransferase n=1 Tax=Clostridium acetobutylicum (strain ATCC 824 / DSM 792 / JCM 1419 / IAM 19013 / LMG 5710 / NBRC 13948 / NRRL B-527 / VKM B-1787 / 2291 / W) TaxID=272562 RepID=Q97HK4_CLOAB|nr:glycosyltransferase [Clostridium acetobutylicum]PSM07562.1 glycosyl transferase [Clostridium sp. NJ4]AAK79966.1 Predicted glycosyltransferase [Clostridium acetobutylicum ATCC 824]ADZ21059.1 glycosyltransferase [Clostridium acetobutylicum EA 2018]AEI32126.1 glycosyltransferase [Clostridium acetobutylicum DSM 1731]AWV79602.1 glycosyl transferase [Clostridium acetobutylicum]
MKKVMFVSFPADGHLNPTIKLCKELSDNNVGIIYYTFDKYFKNFNEVENIELNSYPKEFVSEFEVFGNKANKLNKNLVGALYMLYFCSNELMPFMLEEIKKNKPDLVICDTFGIWGKMAARHCKVPLAIFSAFFLENMNDKIPTQLIISILLHIPQLLKAMSIKLKMDKRYGKICDRPSDILSDQHEFTIVTTSKEFHPNGNKYGCNVKFIGPANNDISYNHVEKDTIFISLGTVSSSDSFWNICINAVAGLGYNVVVSLGGNKNNKVKEINGYDNVKIYEKLGLEEYKNVVRKSVLFISHGGFNSISDAIVYDTPLLIYTDTLERYNNGKAAEERNCGRVYKYKKLNEKQLRKEVIEIIKDSSIKDGLKCCREEFFKSMGYKKVVQELIRKFNLEEKHE